MPMIDTPRLAAFVVRAKRQTYIGDGAHGPSCRPGTVDLPYAEGDLTYLDSYAGGADFLGQELVSHDGTPVWAMNYYGYLLRPDLITVESSGAVLKAALTPLYAQGRFLGGWEHRHEEHLYRDTNTGDVTHFEGREWIETDGVPSYELLYHGGLVRW